MATFNLKRKTYSYFNNNTTGGKIGNDAVKGAGNVGRSLTNAAGTGLETAGKGLSSTLGKTAAAAAGGALLGETISQATGLPSWVGKGIGAVGGWMTAKATGKAAKSLGKDMKHA